MNFAQLNRSLSVKLARIRSFMSLALLVRALVGLVSAEENPKASLDHWKTLVRSKFPSVPQLAGADFALWMADTNRLRPLLLDVRPAAEFSVSHISGATRVDPDTSLETLQPLLKSTQRPIVLYCSVGWRSSQLGQRLIKSGRTQVMNLEGSLFQWANEDRALENAKGPTDQVHPYNATFGRLLKPSKRAVQ